MRKKEVPSEFNLTTKFYEYIQLSKPELYNFDYKVLETAFLVQCNAMTSYAKHWYPKKAFTEEDAAECVLMAFRSQKSNSKTTFLYKLLSNIYDELASNKEISLSVLDVIKNDWCISPSEDQLGLNSTNECSLSGVLDI